MDVYYSLRILMLEETTKKSCDIENGQGGDVF